MQTTRHLSVGRMRPAGHGSCSLFSPAPQDLGAAAGSKRPTCVIMVKPHEEYQEAYDECLEEVQALPPPM